MFNLKIENFFKKDVIVQESMLFKAHGGTYNIDVKIKQSKSCLGGEGWKKFITHNGLKGGEMVCFSLKNNEPRITIVYVGGAHDIEKGPPCILTANKEDRHTTILSGFKSFIGVAYVTRLTRKNLVKHHMVFSLPYHLSLFVPITCAAVI